MEFTTRTCIGFMLSVIMMVLINACGSQSHAVTPTSLATSTSGPINIPAFTPTAAPSETPTETLTPMPGIGSTWTSPVDNMVMLFIPEGDFTMGNDAYDDERPAHTVHLSAFWIDKTEVTNAMHKLCVDAKVCQKPTFAGSYSHSWYYGNLKYADYPVIFVTFVDARDYCSWVGERLPTEAEWEKAARGTDGRLYPWGNVSPICSLANFLMNGRTCTGDPAAVGSFPNGASPYGVLDMAGNVIEWVQDGYDPSYYSHSPQVDPFGPDNSDYRVIRGSSWYSDQDTLRVTNRNFENPYNSYDTLGFRCVRSKMP